MQVIAIVLLSDTIFLENDHAIIATGKIDCGIGPTAVIDRYHTNANGCSFDYIMSNLDSTTVEHSINYDHPGNIDCYSVIAITDTSPHCYSYYSCSIAIEYNRCYTPDYRYSVALHSFTIAHKSAPDFNNSLDFSNLAADAANASNFPGNKDLSFINYYKYCFSLLNDNWALDGRSNHRYFVIVIDSY